ncbi:hypothetical protein TNCT_385211 [Trichonephila clavata]|uniref:Uncharacterized protein n=1 Tax=Trichonephila clavata TaxID=2740835 RepID=A0A8X6G2F1_TRICU|nr:hypothetical protein TNCT_385211 [Trichonephila clavata]
MSIHVFRIRIPKVLEQEKLLVPQGIIIRRIYRIFSFLLLWIVMKEHMNENRNRNEKLKSGAHIGVARSSKRKLLCHF